MARENKTKFAVLGILSWTPLSGYEIKQAYEFSAGKIWSTSYGQLYPALKELRDEGLATVSVQRREGHPERKVYEITESGRAALSAWLEAPADRFQYRVEVLLKVLHGFREPPRVTIRQVERFREEMTARFDVYEATRTNIEARAGGEFDAAVPYWLLTVRCGELVTRGFVDWCDEALAVLRALDHDQNGRNSSKERT